MPPDDNPDPAAQPTTQPGATVPLHAFEKLRRDLNKKLKTAADETAAANAAALAANNRYERAAEITVELQAAHEKNIATLQHEFAASRVFDSIGATGDDHADARSWLNSKYATVEDSIPEGSPEGTEPSKPSFADWVPTYVATSPTMLAYRKTDAAPKATTLDAARTAAGAVKRTQVTDPAQRAAQDAGAVEAPTDRAAFLRLDSAQRRAHMEREGMLAPREPAP